MTALFERMRTACTHLSHGTKSDGEGGTVSTWDEGRTFMATIVRDSSTEARVAEHEGVSNVYTVTTSEVLSHGDVFRRRSDGQTFRVTSDSDDMNAPSMATFTFSQVSAEEWRLPDAD